MAEHHDDHDHGFAHPAPKKLLYAVFIALVGLTILTVVVNDLPLGSMDIWVAMAIASVKASLVMAFFMHMWWEKGFNVLVFLGSVLFVALFIGMTLMDKESYRESEENFPISERPAQQDVLTPRAQ